MLVHLKRRIGVLSAVAVMAAFLTVLPASVATAIPATALVPMPAGDGADYSACPSGSAAAAGFTDTTSTDVDCIAMHGITTGVTATTYEPTANVPRWQMALYLTRMATSAGVTLGSGADQGFTDISGYSAAIQTAINQIKQLGVTVGKTATTYAPDDNVTREEMALFLDRALAATPVGPGGNSAAGGNCLATCLNVNSSSTGTGEYNYDDIDGGSVTFEGHNSIVEIFQLGVTGDLSTVRAFNPSSAITRATMATWLTNALAHTNARPTGLWLQASKYSGWDNATPSLSASYRDSSRDPVAGKVIDFFQWTNAALVANNSAHTAAGACTSNTALTSTSLTKCKVEVGDPTTNTKGNVTAFSVTSQAAKSTTSYFAWSAAAGTTFALATHGSGTEYSTVDVSSTDGADILLMSTNVNPLAAVVASTPYATTVKYGDSITITAQMSAAKVGATYAAVAQALCLVKFVHTIEALAVDDVESVTTTKVFTDANGTATYTFTDADPLAGSAQGDTTHSIVVSDTCSDTVLTSAAAAGYAGHFMSTGSTVEFDFTDDDIAYNTTVLATNATSYKAGSALLPVARSVTSTNLDQYGNAHTASASDTVKFQGAAVSGTGKMMCLTATDACFFVGARIPDADGQAILANANDTITVEDHGLAIGDAVTFVTGTSQLIGGVPAILTIYYVKTAATDDTFTLAPTSVATAALDMGAITGVQCGANGDTCLFHRVEAHGFRGTESVVLRTSSADIDDTFLANTRYYVTLAGLTNHEFGLNETSNATARENIEVSPADDCTLTTCEMFLWHTGATVDRIVGPDASASVAWNDTTTTNGADTVSVYVSTTKEAAKTSYRYILPVVGTTLADDATAIAWVEDAGNDASQLSATPLIWDNANDTLLVKVDHGINNLLLSASVHTLATHATDYLLYTYDAGDQFNLTEGTTTASLAGFEYQLQLHLNAGAGIAFAADTLSAVTYDALAANTSVFSLGS